MLPRNRSARISVGGGVVGGAVGVVKDRDIGLRQQRAEIAVSFRGRRPECAAFGGLVLPVSFVSGIEEGAILTVIDFGNPDGAAAGRSKLVLAKRRERGVEEPAGIHVPHCAETPTACRDTGSYRTC